MRTRKLIKIIITLLLTVGTMVMIFLFSNQNADESTQISSTFTFALFNIEDAAEFELVETIIRKIAHFSEYFVLGFFLMLHIDAVRDFMGKSLRFGLMVLSALIAFGYAGSDEIHQMFVDGRAAMFTDVLIDTAGAMLGIFVAVKCIKRHLKEVKSE